MQAVLLDAIAWGRKMTVLQTSQQEIIEALASERTCTLATCADNRVTIRPMSHVHDGLALSFQTSANSLKMQQIRKNPAVAVCVGTYEMEGLAADLGHPLAESNRWFAEQYRQKHPGSFSAYTALEDEIVVKVSVHLVRQWRYIEGKPHLAEYACAQASP
ncbi:MAG: pyridoxamine 5'-phosphate oxidase family protein [Oscillospiraceae bacterium]|jgi:hypothetical protein|nr:pyridoxamine 5'-phosphate oxidase family protein [Oscillospiraceae bacterium]